MEEWAIGMCSNFCRVSIYFTLLSLSKNYTYNYTRHTNEKNFVGLAVNGDYICCGSENNGVYAYYKMMSKPIVGYKFGSSNPVTVRIVHSYFIVNVHSFNNIKKGRGNGR